MHSTGTLRMWSHRRPVVFRLMSWLLWRVAASTMRIWVYCLSVRDGCTVTMLYPLLIIVVLCGLHCCFAQLQQILPAIITCVVTKQIGDSTAGDSDVFVLRQWAAALLAQLQLR